MALTDKLTAIADAIRSKGGTTGQLTLAGMVDAINAIQTGGGSSAPTSSNDVIFYGYDGTIVASYSLAEAQALTALPDGPTHEGLTFQGWNWSLENVKALTRPMNIGAMYITDDGKTRLYIHIADKARSTVPLYISQTVANGVTIDWGDGSSTETLAGTSYVNTSHAYGVAGDFTISLAPISGSTLGLGNGSPSYCIMGSNTNGNVYCNMLQKVEIGSGVTRIGYSAFQSCYSLSSITIPDGVTSIEKSAFQSCYSLSSITIPEGVTRIEDSAFQYCYSLSSVTIPDGVTTIKNYAFANCYSLSSITIPDGVTTIGNYAFANCYSLSSVTIPDGVTTTGNYAFQYCYSLSSVTIPDGVTSIGNYAFANCYSLSSVTIPDGVTSIGNYAFNSCYSLSSVTIPDGVTTIKNYAFANCYCVAEYHLKPTTPPTLSSTNAFQKIPSDCIIYVPKGCLDAYQNATNWSTYASKMQEEP